MGLVETIRAEHVVLDSKMCLYVDCYKHWRSQSGVTKLKVAKSSQTDGSKQA